MDKLNWDKIKHEYVTTTIGYRLLSEKYSVACSTLGRRAAMEHWAKLRKEYREAVVKKAVRKTANKESNILAKELRLADKITDVLEAALEDAEQFNKYIVQTQETGKKGKSATSKTEEKKFSKVDMKALKDAAETLRIVEGMKRSMQSILTEPERRKFELDEKRLDLAAEKADIDLQRLYKEKDGVETDEPSGVIIMPGQVNDNTIEPVYEDLTKGSIEEQSDDGGE